MALDLTANGTASRHARVNGTKLSQYVSGYTVRETTGAATALVKLRDGFYVPTPTLSQGAAGGGAVTSGDHFLMLTALTIYGEGWTGPQATILAALADGAHHVTASFTDLTAYDQPPQEFAGFNVYVTKANLPTVAGALNPTRIQWFLEKANPSTTVSATDNNVPFPFATLTVASTGGFKSTNGRLLVTTTLGKEVITYTGVTGTTFTGCSGGLGYNATGNAVTQATIPDITVPATYDYNTADGALTATNPPAIATDGALLDEITLAANESVSEAYTNAKALRCGGGPYIEVNSGTVSWEVSGQ